MNKFLRKWNISLPKKGRVVALSFSVFWNNLEWREQTPLYSPSTIFHTIWFYLFVFLWQILHEGQLIGDSSTVEAVAEVLAASQKYMRDQSVREKF